MKTFRMIQIAWLRVLPCAVVACCVTLGCTRTRPDEPTYPVSGSVTVKGIPLKDGFINFESETPDGIPPGSAKIINGDYATKSRAGKKKVSITSNKPTGEKDSGGFDI